MRNKNQILKKPHTFPGSTSPPISVPPPTQQRRVPGPGAAVSPSHAVSAAPSSQGEAPHTAPAPAWGPSRGDSPPSAAPVSALPTGCSSPQPAPAWVPAGSQALPGPCPSLGFPRGSQPPLGTHLLRRGVLHGLQVGICSTMDPHGLQAGICSTMDPHGLQVGICSTMDPHGLRGTACPTVGFTTGCRGISAPAPGAPLPLLH